MNIGEYWPSFSLYFCDFDIIVVWLWLWCISTDIANTQYFSYIEIYRNISKYFIKESSIIEH